MASDVVERIDAYLSGGGMFNPEHANHDAVRGLLIDCRAEVLQTAERARWAESSNITLEAAEARAIAAEKERDAEHADAGKWFREYMCLASKGPDGSVRPAFAALEARALAAEARMGACVKALEELRIEAKDNTFPDAWQQGVRYAISEILDALTRKDHDHDTLADVPRG